MKQENKITNARKNLPGRYRLLSDNDFLECWTALLSTEKWQNKTPFAIGKQLDLLAEYPTEFATYLVYGAIDWDLPFAVLEKTVDDLFYQWKRWTKYDVNQRQETAARTAVLARS